MPALVRRLSHSRASSRYPLASATFDVQNYRSGLSTNAGLPGNLTITSDTPNGVLPGSVAIISTANDWESTFGSYNSPAGSVLGLYVRSAGGNFFENNQAAAGGVISILMDGGEFILPYFETSTTDNGYASILGSYTRQCPLYISPFGLLSPLKPSTLSNVYTSSPINNVVAICTKVPTASDLTLGIRLLPFAPTIAAFA